MLAGAFGGRHAGKCPILNECPGTMPADGASIRDRRVSFHPASDGGGTAARAPQQEGHEYDPVP